MLRFFRLWRLVAGDLRLLWFALRHPRRPLWLWPAVIVLARYARDPVNLALPEAGLVGGIVLIPLLVHLVARLLPAEIRTGYTAASLMR